jgi:glutamine synthetase
MLMAALDGIEQQMHPGEPLDRNIYEMSAADLENVPSTPANLGEALNALEADHAFLARGDVFTDDVITTWIQYKRDHEITPLTLRPHPYEFFLYYDS